MSLLKNNYNLINKIISNFKSIFANKKIINIFYFLLITLIFSLTFRQAPLYQSNQHTKFLHGLAKAGYGYLKNDWLANTIDPLPVFSFLVYLTVKFLNEYFFYFYFIIILGIFIYCILAISDNLFFKENNKISKILFFTIIITLHSTLLDSYFFKFFKYRITELLMEKGVAEQYLLGSYFQPCVFGVFLLLSILFFLKDKPFLSILFLAIPSIVHSAYLFSSATLTLSYMIIVYKEERNFKKVILLGLFSFILALPVLIYNLIYLGPTSSEISKKALDIIVNTRIPHHADPRIWINIDAILKLIIISVAILIIRKKKIFLVLFIPFLIAILFTILQLFINNDFIGFLAPWRESVWLVPISTSIIVGYLINLAFNKLKVLNLQLVQRVLFICCGVLILAHLTYGINGTIKQFNEYLDKNHDPMMNFIKENKNIDDVYLIPPELMEFRLNTGALVFVTYKSHPYKDVELIEWYNRIKISNSFYELDKEKICEYLKNLYLNYKINHIVFNKKKYDFQGIECLKEIYSDNDYIIFKIK